MSEPDVVTAIEHVTDRTTRGLALLTPEHRRPAIQAVGRSWLEAVQEAEDALWQVWSLRIDTSVGDALDQVGEVLAAPRAGLDDVPYRAVLHATALAICSSGAGNELTAVLAELAIDTDLPWRPARPATVVVEPAAHSEIPGRTVFSVLRRAVSAGVRLDVVDVPSGALFAFSDSDATETDTAHGFSDTSHVTGGALVGVIST